MDITTRMDLLLDSGVLSARNYKVVKDVIAHFSRAHGVTLTEENGAGFITHLCIALERTGKGEAVQPLASEVLEESQSEPEYPRARFLVEDIVRFIPELPETEKDYLCVHVGVLLSKLQDS
ncbi:PRD domain-containing protein [Parasphaerochaeta coccoides]|uniref:PRD domain protein n=1 Tax=Parasphaerochaeta coccoides (strain ATCC BAA-1237 / DSM 17374 / SPN1) TaxID=760011 RepID=F4GIV2_PARC1|nr:PRD domain-containing protein [Parasphaerochaeta coccoides]AEC02720.1 PRD domain protein [Parasphaerochaeta coccoides DSM 17374]